VPVLTITGVKNYQKFYAEILLDNTTFLPQYSIQNQMHCHQEESVFFWFTHSLPHSIHCTIASKIVLAQFLIRKKSLIRSMLDGKPFLWPEAKCIHMSLLQNSVFLSLVIYFQKPKGTSAHQARNFVSNFYYCLKYCSCFI
jgi:hypothetical protein